MLSNTRLSEIATKAADLIESKGHAKGCFRNPDENYCLLGAVRRVTSGSHGAMGLSFAGLDPDVKYAERQITQQLASELPDGFHVVRPTLEDAFAENHGLIKVTDERGVARWNDEPHRTKEEVIEFLRRCAAVFAARAKEDEIEATVPERGPVETKTGTPVTTLSQWEPTNAYTYVKSGTVNFTESKPLTFTTASGAWNVATIAPLTASSLTYATSYV